MKIIVTGGRAYADRAALFAALDAVLVEAYGDLTVIEGGASGADALAREWCRLNGVANRTYRARWRDMSQPCRQRLDRNGRPYNALAGFRRNAVMLAVEAPDVVLAFAGGHGTANMVGLARDRGTPVRLIAETPGA